MNDGRYYIGQTNCLESRLNRHQSGQVRSTKSRLPVKLVYFEEFETRQESMFREKYLKSLKSHSAVNTLISNFDGLIV